MFPLPAVLPLRAVMLPPRVAVGLPLFPWTLRGRLQPRPRAALAPALAAAALAAGPAAALLDAGARGSGSSGRAGSGVVAALQQLQQGGALLLHRLPACGLALHDVEQHGPGDRAAWRQRHGAGRDGAVLRGLVAAGAVRQDRAEPHAPRLPRAAEAAAVLEELRPHGLEAGRLGQRCGGQALLLLVIAERRGQRGEAAGRRHGVQQRRVRGSGGRRPEHLQGVGHHLCGGAGSPAGPSRDAVVVAERRLVRRDRQENLRPAGRHGRRDPEVLHHVGGGLPGEAEGAHHVRAQRAHHVGAASPGHVAREATWIRQHWRHHQRNGLLRRLGDELGRIHPQRRGGRGLRGRHSKGLSSAAPFVVGAHAGLQGAWHSPPHPL
mmetsp:Transcript_131293/g.365958  ORF Transcript_131293/g.365958 Transcript_131293/m.365958 type:complete len:379 (+) Transcript_131293:405-1541(+)